MGLISRKLESNKLESNKLESRNLESNYLESNYLEGRKLERKKLESNKLKGVNLKSIILYSLLSLTAAGCMKEEDVEKKPPPEPIAVSIDDLKVRKDSFNNKYVRTGGILSSLSDEVTSSDDSKQYHSIILRIRSNEKFLDIFYVHPVSKSSEVKDYLDFRKYKMSLEEMIEGKELVSVKGIFENDVVNLSELIDSKGNVLYNGSLRENITIKGIVTDVTQHTQYRSGNTDHYLTSLKVLTGEDENIILMRNASSHQYSALLNSLIEIDGITEINTGGNNTRGNVYLGNTITVHPRELDNKEDLDIQVNGIKGNPRKISEYVLKQETLLNQIKDNSNIFTLKGIYESAKEMRYVGTALDDDYIIEVNDEIMARLTKVLRSRGHTFVAAQMLAGIGETEQAILIVKSDINSLSDQGYYYLAGKLAASYKIFSSANTQYAKCLEELSSRALFNEAELLMQETGYGLSNYGMLEKWADEFKELKSDFEIGDSVKTSKVYLSNNRYNKFTHVLPVEFDYVGAIKGFPSNGRVLIEGRQASDSTDHEISLQEFPLKYISHK